MKGSQDETTEAGLRSLDGGEESVHQEEGMAGQQNMLLKNTPILRENRSSAAGSARAGG
jgi:hypothetical protein